MEQAGFARGGVPGEYSPTAASTFATANATTTTSFVELLRVPVVIETPGETLLCIVSVCPERPGGAGGGNIQLSLDGVAVQSTSSCALSAGGISNYYFIYPVASLTPGLHIVTVEWRALALTLQLQLPLNARNDHATLFCQRSRLFSDREMDGVVQRGWQMIYTCGLQYLALAVSKTSTSNTIVDPLLTGLQIVTRAPQSALLIRFNACGQQLDTGLERNVKFQIYVDGVARWGTGDTSGAGGFSGVSFNTGIVAIVPVQAGLHTLDVYWAGSNVSTGLTINPPGNADSSARLAVEEVFCEDVNILSDMEGSAVTNFAGRNLPRIGFQAVTTDVAGNNTDLPICSKLFYVTGDTSFLQIEGTSSVMHQGGQAYLLMIFVDGVLRCGASAQKNNGFIGSASVVALVQACAGNHLVELKYRAVSLVIEAGTHPEYAHANLLIREIAGG